MFRLTVDSIRQEDCWDKEAIDAKHNFVDYTWWQIIKLNGWK